MSAIELLLRDKYSTPNINDWVKLWSEARTELASLRAAAAERDELRARLDDLARKNHELDQAWQNADRRMASNEFYQLWLEDHSHLTALYAELAQATGQPYSDGANFDAHEAIGQLRERITELKSDLRYMSSDHRIEDYAKLEDTIIEQAAKTGIEIDVKG